MVIHGYTPKHGDHLYYYTSIPSITHVDKNSIHLSGQSLSTDLIKRNTIEVLGLQRRHFIQESESWY